MKILIDADASPVRKITRDLAEKFHIDLVIVCNIHHMIETDYGQVITVDAGNDVADHEIVRLTDKGDLVVTQDYGLASLVLLKGAYALHQDGWFYTSHNIDMLLLQRQIGQKMRRAKKRYGHTSKRKEVDDIKFKETLEKFLEERK
ncbi:YaiI/YqxD family protein [Mycoplasmatota bacterium]|nr:YaiI/YqxD family protein [Mycoplasmatota bacterium]